MNPLNPSHLANDNQRKSISTLLSGLLADHAGERVSIRDLIDILGARGYGFLIFILDLPNLIPLPLPGLSTIFGIPMALIGLQMFLRLERPWMPNFVLNRSVERATMVRLFDAGKPTIMRMEKFLKPRLLFLTHASFRPFLGLLIMVMCCVLAMPIPLGNLVLAIPIAIIALGLIEKDGLFILCGMVGGIMALFFNAAIVYVGVEAILAIIHHTI